MLAMQGVATVQAMFFWSLFFSVYEQFICIFRLSNKSGLCDWIVHT